MADDARKVAVFREGLNGDLTILVYPGTNAGSHTAANPASVTLKWRNKTSKTYVNNVSLEAGGLLFDPTANVPISLTLKSTVTSQSGIAGVSYEVEEQNHQSARNSVFLAYAQEYQLLVTSKELDIEDVIHVSDFKVEDPLSSPNAIADLSVPVSKVDIVSLGADIGVTINLEDYANQVSGNYANIFDANKLVSVELDAQIENPISLAFAGQSEGRLFTETSGLVNGVVTDERQGTNSTNDDFKYTIAFNSTDGSDQGINTSNSVRVFGTIKSVLSKMWIQSEVAGNTDPAVGQKYVFPSSGIWSSLHSSAAIKLAYTIVGFGVPTAIVPREVVSSSGRLKSIDVTEADNTYNNDTTVTLEYANGVDFVNLGNSGVPGLRLLSYFATDKAALHAQIEADFGTLLTSDTDSSGRAPAPNSAVERFALEADIGSVDGVKYFDASQNEITTTIDATNIASSNLAVVRWLRLGPDRTEAQVNAGINIAQAQFNETNVAVKSDLLYYMSKDNQSLINFGAGSDPHDARRSVVFASLSATTATINDPANNNVETSVYIIGGSSTWSAGADLVSHSIFENATITAYRYNGHTAKIQEIANQSDITSQAPQSIGGAALKSFRFKITESSANKSASIKSTLDTAGSRHSSAAMDFLDISDNFFELSGGNAQLGSDGTNTATKDRFTLTDSDQSYVSITSNRSSSDLQSGQVLVAKGNDGLVKRVNHKFVTTKIMISSHYAAPFYAGTYPKTSTTTQFVKYVNNPTNNRVESTYKEAGFNVYAIPSTMSPVFSTATVVNEGGTMVLKAVAAFELNLKTDYWPTQDAGAALIANDPSGNSVLDLSGNEDAGWVLQQTPTPSQAGEAAYNSAKAIIGVAAQETDATNGPEEQAATAAAVALIPAEMKLGPYANVPNLFKNSRRYFVFKRTVQVNTDYAALLPQLQLSVTGIDTNQTAAGSIADTGVDATADTLTGLASTESTKATVKINSSGPITQASIKTTHAASGFASDNGVKITCDCGTLANDGVGLVMRSTSHATALGDSKGTQNGILLQNMKEQYNETRFLTTSDVNGEFVYASDRFETQSSESAPAARQSLITFAGGAVKNTVNARLVTRNKLIMNGTAVANPANGEANPDAFYYLNYSQVFKVSNYKREDFGGPEVVNTIVGSSKSILDDNTLKVGINDLNKATADGGDNNDKSRFANESILVWAWNSDIFANTDVATLAETLNTQDLASKIIQVLDSTANAFSATGRNNMNSNVKRYAILGDGFTDNSSPNSITYAASDSTYAWDSNGKILAATTGELQLLAETGKDFYISALRVRSAAVNSDFYSPAHNNVGESAASVGNRPAISQDLNTLIDTAIAGSTDIALSSVADALKNSLQIRSAGQLGDMTVAFDNSPVDASGNPTNNPTITFTADRNGRQLYSAFLIVDEETSFSQGASANDPAAADKSPVLKLTGLQSYVAPAGGAAGTPVNLDGGLKDFVESVSVTNNDAASPLDVATVVVTLKSALELGAGGDSAEKPVINNVAVVVVDGNHEMKAAFA